MVQHQSGNQVPQKSITGPVHLASSLLTGTVGWSAPLAHLCVAPDWAVGCVGGTWCHPEGPGQAWGMQPHGSCAEQGLIRPSARPLGWYWGIPSTSTDCGVNRLKTGYRGRLWDSGKLKIGQELAMCACSPESQSYLGLHQKRCGQQAKGDNSHPLLCFCETPLRALCRVLGFPCTKTDVDLLEWVQKKPQKWSEGQNMSPMKKGWESCGCSSWRRKATGRPYCSLSRGLLLSGLPREAVSCSTLDMFKVKADGPDDLYEFLPTQTMPWF